MNSVKDRMSSVGVDEEKLHTKREGYQNNTLSSSRTSKI